ncbi:MAG: hypothetical protein A3A51_03275 [Candidatus Levybacteria bacterium RIFCSPLOWO2_01_FULL_39_10]|nr:MAG: hypothetical protein A3A51_03275 [Candidatus Levybacteria bacterium RIFCSPLOWO2_01_FULL_39_10]
MRLITLNIWGGTIFEDLVSFLNKKRSTTDVFCFQEVFDSDRNVLTPNGRRSNMLDNLKNILVDFDFLYSPLYHGRDFDKIVNYPLAAGNAIFWKKELKPKEKGQIFTHNSEDDVRPFPNSTKPDVPRNFQYLAFDKFIVLNIHGYWNPAPKTDTPKRLEQSQKIINFIESQNLPALVCGDFNLAISTKSVEILESSGLRNLVRESKAKTTRTKYYNVKWRKKDKFADYIFASSEINVFDFKVLPDAVSDHSALFVEFEV